MITTLNEFKKILETVERNDTGRMVYTTYRWSTYTATIAERKGHDRFSWTIEEDNGAFEPIHSSDYADYANFKEAEDDMFQTINDRIGTFPERMNENKVTEDIDSDGYTLQSLKNMKIVSVGFANYGTLASREENEKLYYITGYLFTFHNGMKMVTGGGSASSKDFVNITLLSKDNQILAEWEEDLY